MSVSDLSRRVTTVYVADTTSLEEGHRRAKSSSEHMSHGMISDIKEIGESVTGFVDELNKISRAYEGIAKIGEFMWDGYKDGIQDARNATLSMGVNIDKLKESAHGLVTENDLLALSARAMSSQLKNNQDDLENAAKAIVARQRRGVEAAEAQNLITEALVAGRTRGLEPYGIIVDRHLK